MTREPAEAAGEASMSKSLNDLFRWYGIPPSPLHWAVQEAARQEGWTPPWVREEQQSKKKTAGKKSGLMRAGRAEIRRSVIRVARARLNLYYEPYANASIDALHKEYRNLVGEGSGENCASLAKNGNDLCLLVPLMLAGLSKADQQMLKTVGRETLIKDLKLLRKWLKKQT
jgi:hypothetical protein